MNTGKELFAASEGGFPLSKLFPAAELARYPTTNTIYRHRLRPRRTFEPISKARSVVFVVH
jgi:hypothetical protein